MTEFIRRSFWDRLLEFGLVFFHFDVEYSVSWEVLLENLDRGVSAAHFPKPSLYL